MKGIVISLVFFYSFLDCGQIQQVRDNFHQIDSEDKLENFIQDIKNVDCHEAIPYKAAAIMRQAEYCIWPGSKLSYFSKGKTELEAYISENQNCIEGRYVRALVQSQLPIFLGYCSNVSEDCDFVKKHIDQSDLTLEYKTTILTEIESIQKEL